MANGLKTTLTRLCRYLQDPYHVARFQQLCGVKGTFPPQNTTEDDLTSNGVCVKQGLREEDVGPKQRNTASNRLEQNDCSKGLLKGEAGSVAADEPNAGSDLDRRIETGHRMAGQQFELGNDEKTGVSMKRAKPLRKNSLTGEVGQEFIINNPFLFYLFTFGTELGNEMFFIVFFLFFMWNVDAFVSRLLILVWNWNRFFCQCDKDLILWTRPTPLHVA